MSERKLNLGCGNDIRKGWINLDIIAKEGVNVVHDLNDLPLPFADNTFDYIFCRDIFEHIDYIPLMSELHRILKKRGILRIKVPHFTSRSNYADPTHINKFSSNTFYYFIYSSEFAYERNINLFTKIYVRLEIEQSKIPILKTLLRLLYNKVNKSYQRQNSYERTFLRLFPCESLRVILIK